MTDIVRVIRILEYVGPRELMESTLRNGFVPANGSKQVGPKSMRISSVILGDFPEILKKYIGTIKVDPNEVFSTD